MNTNRTFECWRAHTVRYRSKSQTRTKPQTRTTAIRRDLISDWRVTTQIVSRQSIRIEVLSHAVTKTHTHYLETNTMGGKKDKKSDAAAAAGPPSIGNTSKFAVLDYPGQPQPAVAPASSKKTAAAASTGLQGRRAVAGSGPQMDSGGAIRLGGDSFLGRTNNPEWIQHRCSVYDQVKAKREAELASKNQSVPISVTLPDGKVLDKNKQEEPYVAWKTTPLDVAATIAQGLADATAVARVTYSDFVADYSLFEDGMEAVDTLSEAMEEEEKDGGGDANKTFLWDMTRPLVGSVAKMEFLKFDGDADAKTVFWHSSAHMMGEALEHLFGSKLTIGPPLAGGFYYDSYMGTDTMAESDCTYAMG